MPVTPIYQLPFPAPTDPADVPLDMQELAERMETVLGGLNVIADATVSSAGQPISFPSIPATFSHLRLVAFLRSAGSPGTPGYARFNNDAASNYGYQTLAGIGAAASAALTNPTTFALLADIPGSSTGATIFAAVTADIPFYRTSNSKGMISHGGGLYSGGVAELVASFWGGTAAISRIDISAAGGLAVGSRATVYGLT